MLQGEYHPDFEGVARMLGRLVGSGRGGAAVCVYHRGLPVVDLWGGVRDAAGHPWERDTLALSYSTSKGVVATLLHVLADRGLLDYDDPVADYWPEFAIGGKHPITVRHLLSHQAGLFDVRAVTDHARHMLDWSHMTRALAASRPAHVPGEGPSCYHALTFGWLVGELIERVTGKSFGEVLASEIAAPLELDGCFIGLPESELWRRAELLDTRIQTGGPSLRRAVRVAKTANVALRATRAPRDLGLLARAFLPLGMDELDFNSEEVALAAMPAANGMFTARSLAKLYAALANGGKLGGVRLLSSGTLHRATTIQDRGIDRVLPLPMQWRLGYHRAPVVGARVPHAFGHWGFGGSGAWADPDRDLAVALVLNRGVGTLFGDTRIVRISSAALRCAERR